MTHTSNKEWGFTEIDTTVFILAEILDTLKEILSEIRSRSQKRAEQID